MEIPKNQIGVNVGVHSAVPGSRLRVDGSPSPISAGLKPLLSLKKIPTIKAKS